MSHHSMRKEPAGLDDADAHRITSEQVEALLVRSSRANAILAEAEVIGLALERAEASLVHGSRENAELVANAYRNSRGRPIQLSTNSDIPSIDSSTHPPGSSSATTRSSLLGWSTSSLDLVPSSPLATTRSSVFGWSASSLDLVPSSSSGAQLHGKSPLGAQEDPRVACTGCREGIGLDEATLAPCQHSYCFECIQRLFLSCLKNVAQFPPRCCDHEVKPEHVRGSLPQHILTRYLEVKEESETVHPKYCHQSRCSAFLKPAHIQGPFATCPACSSTTCTKCNGPGHFGGCTADQDVEKINRLAEEFGWKRCPNPRCNRMVSRTFGCNHMVCICRTEWCYMCTKRWGTCECGYFGRVRPRHWIVPPGEIPATLNVPPRRPEPLADEAPIDVADLANDSGTSNVRPRRREARLDDDSISLTDFPDRFGTTNGEFAREILNRHLARDLRMNLNARSSAETPKRPEPRERFGEETALLRLLNEQVPPGSSRATHIDRMMVYRIYEAQSIAEAALLALAAARSLPRVPGQATRREQRQAGESSRPRPAERELPFYHDGLPVVCMNDVPPQPRIQGRSQDMKPTREVPRGERLPPSISPAQVQPQPRSATRVVSPVLRRGPLPPDQEEDEARVTVYPRQQPTQSSWPRTLSRHRHRAAASTSREPPTRGGPEAAAAVNPNGNRGPPQGPLRTTPVATRSTPYRFYSPPPRLGAEVGFSRDRDEELARLGHAMDRDEELACLEQHFASLSLDGPHPSEAAGAPGGSGNVDVLHREV
ncbi:hypothetical protein BJ875DRAFT_452222 [Amylocarpus encephaloides]|uniref:RING-type domain-containing protein n=1 Tax=Amylocarpus encephaloides TaxID=45428 RepID=A0A9P7YQQ8_9HELO|nr:hypothetical protein BJ875DRAFT_452222 [Amylocarpus encephaloides]